MGFNRLLTGLVACVAFSVQADSVDQYIAQLPVGTAVSLRVQKVGASTPLIDYRAQQLSLPASTQKVITALAALLQLGADYRFTTTLESSGIIRNGVLHGDLIARFRGDPGFTRTDLRTMVASLTKAGIKKIDGNLLIDTSVFASHDEAPGWPWNDLTQCFSAPPSAAIIDHNCFSVSLDSSGEPGELAAVRVAAYYPVTMLSQVRIVAKADNSARYCELDVVSGDVNRYTLTGCLMQRKEALPLTFAVQDGAGYAGAILKAELARAGISFSGVLLRQTTPTTLSTVLASKVSAPLHSLLQVMLKKSDNMIADTVFRTIGGQYFGVAGTWRAGADAVRQILRQKAGIDLANSIIVDGSGLSRHDLISADTMMQVLQYIAQNDNQLNFISMLPLAGVDGTLQYRPGLHSAGLDHKVSAKTGSLQGVYNLAGFITLADGQKLAFVQYISGYAVRPTDQRNRRAPLVNFESQLYKEIYQNTR